MLAQEAPAFVADAADAPAPILVADEAREDEEVVEVRAEAIDGEDDFDAEEDIDLSNELASISDDDADAGSVAAESTGVDAMPSFDDADLDVSPFARRRRPAFRDGELVLAKFVAERFAPEEVVEELVVEVVAAPDETAVAEPDRAACGRGPAVEDVESPPTIAARELSPKTPRPVPPTSRRSRNP